MKKIPDKYLNLLLRLFWPGFLFSLIVLFSPGTGGEQIKYLDKLVHFLLFAFLSWSAFLRFSSRFWVGSLIVIYIVMAEIIQQYFIPGRGLEFTDALAGLIGLLAAFVIWSSQ